MKSSDRFKPLVRLISQASFGEINVIRGLQVMAVLYSNRKRFP
jgi:hypothetical protein